MLIKCVPLGAGQDVGKSCVIVTIGSKNIMFDCGMHMGYQDERRYPKFSFLSKTGNYTQAISCVIITHFHLDHIGALPYFTEVCGYDGPIYMTYPTKALAPLMLEDYRKVLVDKKGEQELFSMAQIQQCMKKVTAVDLKQTIMVDNDLEIRAYYAGHVLGAAMFYCKVGDDSVVYTGDYNMTPDRHLGAAQIDPLEPDLLITESTYATTVRDSKRAREREFLKKVHNCVSAGGKVLIPVFALGRAQELCILLDEYWERMNLSIPIYFSAGLTMQANVYYKLLISWTNQKVKDTFVTRNTFDFKHVSPFDQTQIDAPGPCVLFATPGMLSGGLSLEVFRHWAPSELNMVVVPGFCVAGTVGNKLISGKTTKLEIDKRSPLDVRCQIHQLSFSAHTDAKGIMDLVKHVNPRNVVLVHGEKPKMATLKARITSDLGIPCFDPANHETLEFSSRCTVKVSMSKEFVTANMEMAVSIVDPMRQLVRGKSYGLPYTKERVSVEGVVLLDEASKLKILHTAEAPVSMNVKQHDMTFTCEIPILVLFCIEESEEVSRLHTSRSGKVSPGLSPWPGAPGAQRMLNTGNQGTDFRRKEGIDLQMVPEEVEDVSWKKYRMDVKKSLSLNLEREPDIESGEELDSAAHEDQEASSLFTVHEKNPAPSTGMSRLLDINAVPESSSEMEVDHPEPEQLAAPPVRPPSQISVLHALYVGLKELYKLGPLKQEGDSISSRSFSLQVCAESLVDPSYSECLGLKVEGFPPPVPDNKNGHVIVAVLECSWSYEDDALAWTIVDILRRSRLKMN
ncbi:unnamed protein product [Calypogeia fissa]